MLYLKLYPVVFSEQKMQNYHFIDVVLIHNEVSVDAALAFLCLGYALASSHTSNKCRMVPYLIGIGSAEDSCKDVAWSIAKNVRSIQAHHNISLNI